MTQAVSAHSGQLRRPSRVTFSPPSSFLIMGHVSATVLGGLPPSRTYHCPSDRVPHAGLLRFICPGVRSPERSSNRLPICRRVSRIFSRTAHVERAMIRSFVELSDPDVTWGLYQSWSLQRFSGTGALLGR